MFLRHIITQTSLHPGGDCRIKTYGTHPDDGSIRKAPPDLFEHFEAIGPLELIFAHHDIEAALCYRLVEILFTGDLMQHRSWKTLPQTAYKAIPIVRIVIDNQK